jgi:hypothetical protein
MFLKGGGEEGFWGGRGMCVLVLWQGVVTVKDDDSEEDVCFEAQVRILFCQAHWEGSEGEGRRSHRVQSGQGHIKRTAHP